MNILLIDHYAGSPEYGMEYRPFYFAREWVRAGHRVLIVAADHSHLRRVAPQVTGLVTYEVIEGVEYLWVRSPDYHGNRLGRARNIATFLLRLRGACSKSITAFRPNVVIASSTYTWDNYAAARYAKAFNALHVYEVHDLWPLSLIELAGVSPRNPIVWSLQRAENFACQHADKIVSILPATSPHLVAHGMMPDRFIHIPNGIVEEDWLNPTPLPPEHKRVLMDLRARSRCVAGYAGGINLINHLDVLVEAAADPRLRDVAVVCVGDGPFKRRLTDEAKALGSKVHFLDSVPKSAVPTLLEAFDVLYIGWARSPLFQFGVSPNKLFEYMMAGKPIVCAIEAANDPVREAGCGLSVMPDNPSAACEAILSLSEISEENRRDMGERGRRYVKEHHRVSLLAQRFLDSLQLEDLNRP